MLSASDVGTRNSSWTGGCMSRKGGLGCFSLLGGVGGGLVVVSHTTQRWR